MTKAAGIASCFQRIATRLRSSVPVERAWADDEAPLRSELFSADQMELHGRALAAAHRLSPARTPDQLLARLADNEIVLTGVCKLLAAAITAKLPVTPAGEWLLDNFYLIEEQIRTARRHLPKGYSRELPRLDRALSGALAAGEGRPRVYDMALEIIAHGDGRVDMDVLARFVAAYQSVTALRLGELWATPIMLRLAVIENLRRVAVRIAAGRSERNLANTWADRMMAIAESDPNSLILVIADMARSNPPMDSAFVAEMARRLQGRGPALMLALTWMEQRLSESGLTIEQSVQLENQQQAADQVSISNSIGSLRVLGATDWRDFVETMSRVEKTLRADPAACYAHMDFATRDRYRHATERIAKKCALAEDEVARKAVELASIGAGNGSDERATHVGYYLIDRGLAQLEVAAGVRRSLLDSVQRSAARHPLLLYLAPIMLITASLSWGLLTQVNDAWAINVTNAAAPVARSYLLRGLLGSLVLLAASQLAVAMVNWLATLLIKPHALPAMDYSKGIAEQARTLVVVPTMLTSAASVERLLEALEVRFVGNRDANLDFGLLTDFVDADQQSLPGDEALVEQASAGIDELNDKYGDADERSAGRHFFLFHRNRRWNPQEGRWMGYERKRGKLAALNAQLRPATTAGGEGFARIVGDVGRLGAVKYVITLDTDTLLPRDSARQFVGAMAHPLNRPRYDAVEQRVVDGYGILQPRVAISLPGTNRSRYARLYGGEPGIDPYTRAVSDVYQDVFGEGSFIGKGIYDVDAFAQAIGDRFPENQILSHDLLEGCYARSGLLSNVNLYEDYPARYRDDVARRYRWLRGDWQLAGWLRRAVPGAAPCAARAGGSAATTRAANPLSLLSQWKLLDNLRRSLVPAALTLLLIIGWSMPPAAGLWTCSLIAVLLLPRLCAKLVELLRKPAEILPRQHFAALAEAVARDCTQTAFEIACLPYEAFFSLGAIARTLWRMRVSHRRMLEWNPSSQASHDNDARGSNEVVAALRAMWIAPALAVALTIALARSAPESLAAAAPILLLWLAAPTIAGWMSRPLAPRPAKLTTAQDVFLRTLARRIWAFFEKYVAAEDHWLPPDNCQEYRVAAVAHRTSPTNIGMALLANLSAYDFGYLTAGQVATRTALTLRTLDQLERYRGHFFNWYDTQTLQPLSPLYVSTVDSGNLAGHLLTLRAGLLALRDDSILPAQLFAGLSDTFGLLDKLLESESDLDLDSPLATLRNALASALATPGDTLAARHAQLTRLAVGADDLLVRMAPRVSSTDSEATPDGSGVIGAAGEAAQWAQALAGQCRATLAELDRLAPWLATPQAANDAREVGEAAALAGVPTLRELAEAGSEPARDRLVVIEGLAQQAGELAQMDYEFLYDKTRHLLAIGYNVGECRLDAGYYDLLASEARLSCFVAIAQGQVPQDVWFALGRLLTSTTGDPVLLSWSGSMFEYLMPLLIMPTYDNTLLDQTCKAAVARQIEYGRQRGVAWGVSESGYNAVDAHLNYQYRAFGVPGLGLKRGLSEELVVAPYASVLALMVAPEAACLNLQRLAADGFLGRFGFFEAIDYTPARQRRHQNCAVVRSFMAHHQGMSLLALAYLLLDRPMQRRFAADRQFQSVLPLLQERIPKAMSLFSHTAILSEIRTPAPVTEMPIRVFKRADTPIPEVQLLSNGRYHVMVTNAGGGYSRWKNLAVTRWREDGTCDPWGSFCYLRELTGDAEQATGRFWSSAYQPAQQQVDSYEAIFSEGRAEFRRRDAVAGGSDTGEAYFETHTEIVVSPEDDIELRRVHITNRSRQARVIEVTSYAEVVIAPVAEDALHPAFSNLFVHTEIVRERRAILATRRPRSQGEAMPWLLHRVAVHGAQVGTATYETDRARFIGRGRNVAAPQAMDEHGVLSGSEGSVLDPIVAIRHTLTLAANQSVTVDIVSGIAETREGALSLIDKYQDRRLADRVLDLAWTHSQVVLRQLNVSEAEAQLHARLAGSVIFANTLLRAEPALLMRNRRGQSGLWGYAISGDLPIVLLQIADVAHLALVRQLVQAHAYWRTKGLAVDLVIWNEDHAGYRQQLQDQIIGLITSGIEASVIDRPGGIFVRLAEQISGEDRILFQSVARAVISDTRGSLEEQLGERRLADLLPPRLLPSRAVRRGRAAATLPSGTPQSAPSDSPLQLFNGLGGYSADGSEYVIALAPGQTTPAPWVNVLANPSFGTVISENGAAYTWSENAHEYRLTPWHNDPVSDASGEAFYLRDEESGHFWSPTPLPASAGTPYVIRHGYGYSVFSTHWDGIISELWVYVALDAPVKFSVLKLRNDSGRPRRLSATGYVEWVLGDLRAKSAMHITSEIEPRSGALYARNQYSTEFSDRQAFFDVDERARTVSSDRREFIGRNGSLQNPAAMHRLRLSGRVGAGHDPCAAIQVAFDLANGGEREVIFRLGAGRHADDAGRLVQRFRGAVAARAALDAVRLYWRNTLGAVHIETPDASLNVLTNGWLVYQTLACRLWARSAYYQSGGAFGFRDQLQDVMALIHATPGLAREHLLLCASRQFVEGDVQHWWHPPSGRGVRTHCSDDYLWLPLAVCRYVRSSGDSGVLDEPVGFLEGRPVNPEDDSYYDLPAHSAETASLYEHCARAIRHGQRFGAHGLPLIGSGDWNDGMNLVGNGGKGESVWLGFFLYDVLRQFAALATDHGDAEFARLCSEQGALLRDNIEAHGWDGAWYRRAYFDDGTPLGSAGNDECRIDSIAQSWSVLSGAGDEKRSRQAMQAVDKQLVRRDEALVQLLDPPFNSAPLNPGYIRGYVPGVRENGGQYTHAAIWAAMAFAALGERERAWELLRMINPVNHALSAAATAIYKVEPYVVAADVYALAPHTGRGGWSWYTGSAGWMYRLIVESLLGLRLDGGYLRLAPCLPADWKGCAIAYRYRETTYHLAITQTAGGSGSGVRVTVDGVERSDQAIALIDDRLAHKVEVVVSGSK